MKLSPVIVLSVLAGLACAVIAVVAFIATWIGIESKELIKSVVVPLLSPTVAILVPTWLFFVLPNRRAQRESAQESIEYYFSDYVRNARLVGWAHLVTDVSGKDKETSRVERQKAFVDYVTTTKANTEVSSHNQEIYQRISLVLDFFAVLEGLIEDSAVDEKMLRKSLVYYYHWWRDEVLEKLRILIQSESPAADVKYVPLWMKPMANLDRLIREQTSELALSRISTK